MRCYFWLVTFCFGETQADSELLVLLKLPTIVVRFFIGFFLLLILLVRFTFSVCNCLGVVPSDLPEQDDPAPDVVVNPVPENDDDPGLEAGDDT